MAVSPVVVQASQVVRVPPVLAAPRAQGALPVEPAPLVVVLAVLPVAGEVLPVGARVSVAVVGEAAVLPGAAAARSALASLPGSVA